MHLRHGDHLRCRQFVHAIDERIRAIHVGQTDANAGESVALIEELLRGSQWQKDGSVVLRPQLVEDAVHRQFSPEHGDGVAGFQPLVFGHVVAEDDLVRDS